MLNSTPYPNISRIVSGAVLLYPNDGIILCDTSTAPVTMTLQEIPANNWQTTWKLFVLDNNNNAGTHNIVISAPSGYSINNLPTLTINTNGGGVTITIASNTAFFGQVSPLPSGGGGGSVTSITASSPLTGGTITTSGSIGISDAAADGITKGAATFTANDFDATSGLISIDYTNGQAASGTTKGFLTSTDWTRFDDKTTIQVGLDPATQIAKAGTISFNSASFKITSPSVNVANVKMFDSGWVDLLGFAWMDATLRPKCRRYGNAIYFKGSAVVPMGDPSNPANLYQPYDAATTFFYEKVENATTYTGVDAGGCIVDSTGVIKFNQDSSVLPTSVFDPSAFEVIDSSYYTGWKPQYRRFFCDIGFPISAYRHEVSVTAVLNTFITTAGQLRTATIFDIENGISTTLNSGLIGSSTYRMLTPNIVQGDVVPNYIARDVLTGENAQVGSVDKYLGGEATFSGANLNILTITSVPSGTYIQAGQTILTSGFAPNTIIRYQLTGVGGGAGTYFISDPNLYVGSSFVLLLSPSLNAPMQTGITPYNANYTSLGVKPYVFPFDMDGSKPSQLGGMIIDLSGLVVFIDPKTY